MSDFPKAKNRIIGAALQRPADLMWNTLSAVNWNGVPEAEMREALEYFNANRADRYAYTICTAKILRSVSRLGKLLQKWGMPGNDEARFWPLWCDDTHLSPKRCTLKQAEARLRELWNERSGVFLAYQLGALTVRRRGQYANILFFECQTPINPIVTQSSRNDRRVYGGSFVVAYDRRENAYYTMNSRAMTANAHEYNRYFEVIDCDIQPPDIEALIRSTRSEKRSIGIVLDEHIGDSLSVLSTHVPAIAQLPGVAVTIYANNCRFLESIAAKDLNATFRVHNIRVSRGRIDPWAHDLIIDPYDLVPGSFALKPQNDSGQISIISAVELGHHVRLNVRRDIMDIHASALRRIGFMPPDEAIPGFIDLRFGALDRTRSMMRVRKAFWKTSFSGPAKLKELGVVAIFPIGATDDGERHYPSQHLGQVIAYLLKQPNIIVALIGGGDDKNLREFNSALAAAGLLTQPSDIAKRVIVFFGESLKVVRNIVSASDVVVSMDSGPLHLARALRLYPIGLYTGKVNDPRRFLLFPWFVDDGTIEALTPEVGEDHVSPGLLCKTIANRLRRLRLAKKKSARST
ncbi:MAG TPA: glycosyltransferase family 9 protein [Lacipirellulaceae bacterium]|nr:glycosyltransferase family 9 protein [Lacipirellulaceae bacterium]